MKQLTLEDVQTRLNVTYPQETLALLSYTKMKEPSRVKCLTCGKEFEFTKAENMFIRSKHNICRDCNPHVRKEMADKIEQFKKFIETSDTFELVTDLESVIIHASTYIDCRCKRCGNITGKSINDYLRGRGCTYCMQNKKKTTAEFADELSEDYEILDEYTGAFNYVTLRHNCGFTYKVKPHNYLCGKGCPRCNRKISRGEKAISAWLDAHKIAYKKEFQIELDGHLLRFDFYLPGFDKYIEFQGIQHYKPVEYFGGESRFEKQVAYDKLKINYAGDKLVIVSFEDLDRKRVEQVLEENLLKLND